MVRGDEDEDEGDERRSGRDVQRGQRDGGGERRSRSGGVEGFLASLLPAGTTRVGLLRKAMLGGGE